MPSGLTDLEKLVGHTFRDVSLLERAVTHRSWAFENLSGKSDAEMRAVENELSEFLGDSVLGLAIAESLFRAHPDSGEGELTLMKHHLVSTATLAKLANEMDLGRFLRVGRGEDKSGGRKKQALLANTLEAVIGAIFLDAGYIAARVSINKIFAAELKSVSPETALDYKSLLQETLQGDHRSAPSYSVVRTDGPPHERVFHVEATWEDGTASGNGPSIKAAEMMAASRALEMIDAGKTESAANA